MIYIVMIEKGARRQADQRGLSHSPRRFRRVHRWPDARGLEPEQPADAVQRVKPRRGAWGCPMRRSAFVSDFRRMLSEVQQIMAISEAYSAFRPA